MTNCTQSILQFSPLNRKQVSANFTGGHISSDGGILLLREVDKQCSLTHNISRTITDKRHQGYVTHGVEAMLKQRIYALAAGYEDVNDHDHLRQDVAFQTAVGREVVLASSATLSRFENSMTRSDLVEMSKQLVEHFIGNQSSVPTELTLDFDPTDHTLYGRQQGRHYHGYYGDYCYLPLQVFCGAQVLVSLLRESHRDGARYAGAILKLLVKRFRQQWPDVKIIFRGDGAFARKALLHWCENHQVDYIVGIGGNKRLQALASSLASQAKEAYQENEVAQRLFEEFSYGAKSWHCERRIIAKAEHNNLGANLRFVITTLAQSPQQVYDQCYCPRGNMENGIKQLKLDLYADRNSCQTFAANQFRVLLSSIAYNLLIKLRLSHCQLTRVAKAYAGTLRLKLIKIGAVIIKNTRRIQFLLASHHPYQKDFILAANSINSS